MSRNTNPRSQAAELRGLMTPAEYRATLATLGLSQLAAGRWLGVSNKTAQRYATDGPSPPAARAIRMRLALEGLERRRVAYPPRLGGTALDATGPLVRHADVIAAIGDGK